MTRFKTLAAMVIGVVALIGVAALCPAQTGPLTTQPPVTQPPVTVPTTDNGVLTAQSLKVMLSNLGYEVREEKTADSLIYWITVIRGSVTYNIDMNISPNGEKIWAMVPLADVPANVELPSARLLKLLELNQTMVGPSHFVFVPVTKQIYLNRALENRGVTPKLLRELIDRVTSYCDTTREFWEVSKWPELKMTTGPK